MFRSIDLIVSRQAAVVTFTTRCGSRESTMAAMIDAFSDIPTFLAVVEAGGFAAASRTLNQTRSAVSKAVARLEGRLGVALFLRTTRTQTLTDSGQAFYVHCQRALAELKAGEARLDASQTRVNGKLRVSMPVLFGRLCVAPVLVELAKSHVELELEMQFSDRPIDLIDEGFDLSVRMGLPSAAPGLMTRRIGRETMAICASPAYLADRTLESLDDLVHHECIAYSRGGRVQTWRFPQARHGIREMSPASRLRLDDLDAIADAASAGFGVAWLPLWLVQGRIDAGSLVECLPALPALGFDIHLLWPESQHQPLRVRTAIDALIAGVSRFVGPR